MNMNQCGYCPEAFFSSYSLMSHMRVHTTGNNNTKGGNNKMSLGSLNQNNTAFPAFPMNMNLHASGNGNNQAMDYSWPQNSWQYLSSSSTTSSSSTNLSNNSFSKNTNIKKEAPVDDDDSDSSTNDSSTNEPSSKKNGKIYKCQDCTKIFKSYPGLRYHRNSAHTQDGAYPCKYCSKRFCQKSHLSRHETLHTGVKEHNCSFCEKTFRIKGNLQIHERIHTGDKPYQCSSCEKRFTQQQSLKSHERLHKKYKH